MNDFSPSYLQALGPIVVANILKEYDILYEKLLSVPTGLWLSKDMKDYLESTTQISVLEDMHEVYKYILQVDKQDVVAIWLKLLKNK